MLLLLCVYYLTISVGILHVFDANKSSAALIAARKVCLERLKDGNIHILCFFSRSGYRPFINDSGPPFRRSARVNPNPKWRTSGMADPGMGGGGTL